MNAPTHTNFFEQRSTEYGKGEIEGWPTAFDFLTSGKVAQYRVYTMPGCPHCERAVNVLKEHAVPFDYVLIEDAELRAQKKSAQGDWKTFPMIYRLDSNGMDEVRFVGGADAIVNELVSHQ
jgi:Glutaredoxin and related proteins